MTKSNDDAGENIFHMVDRLVRNVGRTKKIAVLMIIVFVLSIPLSFHIMNTLVNQPYSFGPARLTVPFIVIFVFIVVGVKQSLVLSRWTKIQGMQGIAAEDR